MNIVITNGQDCLLAIHAAVPRSIDADLRRHTGF